MIDPRRLLTFREVARRGSFSRAGEALALTQPAVSQQVAALERQLGVRLLDRGPGDRPTPTEVGALLLAHADAIAGRLAQADAQIEERVRAERDTLRAGTFASALAALVPGAIADLHAERPALEIEVAQTSAEAAGAAVAAGELHVAFCFQDAAAPRAEPEGTVRHDVGAEEMRAAVAANHPLAGRERIALGALAEETWTAPSRGQLVYRACRAAGFEPRIAYLTTDPLAIGALVARGLAVALAPQLLDGRLPGVAAVPLEEPVPRRALYALTPAAGASPAAERFVAALAGTLAAR